MAMVANAFVNNLVGKMIALAEGEMSTLLGVEEEVKKLQRRLERLQGFLQYAEQNRHTGSLHIITLLKDLKDVMYDADDIIDTCMMEGGKLLGVQRPSPSSMVCSASDPFKMISSCFRCLKYRHELGADIKKLHDRIDEIAKDNQIMATFTSSAGAHSTGRSREVAVSAAGQTSHLQDITRIVGSQIEEHAQKLIACIVDDDGQEKCRVFAITGMGGIGKTTLARKVFNHEIITSNFRARHDEAMSSNYFSRRRIWLHVSKNYSETELLKEMVRNLAGSDEGLKSREELDAKLVSLLPESLFLVLDDVWMQQRDKSTPVWDNLLRDPLENSQKSVRVLVTTRNERVAKNLRASYIHHVQRMDDGSCWELLCREVFMDRERDEIDSLREIGYKIVKKCDGLPLAIKAIAGVLKTRDKNVTEWDKVVRSEIWSMRQIDGQVPRALYLSYDDLSAELKQCFTYCSFISENGQMGMTDVVAYLVDEGLVPPPKEEEDGRLSMEEVAEEWYRELIWRNLLQVDPISADGTGCTMHDLLQSFGRSLMEGEATCIRNRDQRVRANSLMKLRRLSMMSDTGETLKLPDGLTGPEHLRAFFLSDGSHIKSIGEDLVGELRNLRILMLSDTKLEGLPRSVCDLFHLRHLDLDGTNIKEIPDSIGSLSNLQTLRAGRCQFLHQLPNTVTSLLKLRLLNLRHTQFSHVPKGLGKLQDLHTVEGLVVGHEPELISRKGEESCDLDELQHLSNLKVLGLHKLHRSNNIGERAASALADKSFLRHLELSAEAATALSQEQIQRTKIIYDGLTLPCSLQILEFDKYPCLEFPKWMMAPPPPPRSSLGDSFPNLRILIILNAKSCRELPPQLSWLPQLRYLRVSSADAITAIGPQFFSCGPRAAVAFPKLEILEFTHMPNWEEWSSSSVDGHEEVDQGGGSGIESTTGRMQLLPSLTYLLLVECPMLKALPGCLYLATNLQKLTIQAAPVLKRINKLPLSDEMSLLQCEGLEELSDLPSLRRLTIAGCPALESVRNLHALQYLTVDVMHLPTWLPSLARQPRFKKLDIYCPSKLFKDFMENDPHWLIHHTGEGVIITFHVRGLSS